MVAEAEEDELAEAEAEPVGVCVAAAEVVEHTEGVRVGEGVPVGVEVMEEVDVCVGVGEGVDVGVPELEGDRDGFRACLQIAGRMHAYGSSAGLVQAAAKTPIWITSPLAFGTPRA